MNLDFAVGLVAFVVHHRPCFISVIASVRQKIAPLRVQPAGTDLAHQPAPDQPGNMQ